MVEYERIRLGTSGYDTDFSQDFNEKVKEKHKKGEKFVLFYKDGDSFFTKGSYTLVVHENKPIYKDGKQVFVAEELRQSPVKFFKKNNDNHFYFYTRNGKEEAYKMVQLKLTDINYTDTTEKIENYTCRLVEFTLSGQNYKAWYTEDIPINTGPFAFGTFPGVVLKIEAPQYIIYATKISNEFSANKLEKMDENLPVFKEHK